jgi:FixJ family two-component response regulator
MSPAATVFVIDDDPSIRRALERLFRSEGWTVQTFESAEEFLRQDLSSIEGCLVVDVHLGRMTGFDLQVRLSRLSRLMPVIVTSGVDDEDIEVEGRRLGAVAFFRKPFDVEALMDSVSQCLRRPPSAS